MARRLERAGEEARKRLYERRARLQQELAEVDQALQDLDDPAVQKVLRVTEAAYKL